MWNNVKTTITTMVIGAFVGIMIFLKFKEGEDSADALEEAKLEGQEAIVDQDTAEIQEELDNIGIESATEAEVVDFWEGME